MKPWLVIIDPQVIFADSSSPWYAPGLSSIIPRIDALTEYVGTRRIVTRWVPGREHPGSWKTYFEAWPFADRPESDPLFELIPQAHHWVESHLIARPTFSKWCDEMIALTGQTPTLILTGVSTDCCVISTALAAVDAGAHVIVASDACAGSNEENHTAAMQIMELFAPQILILPTTCILSSTGGNHEQNDIPSHWR